MAKAPIAERRDPEDIGAAIISAWFKVLPDAEIATTRIEGPSPLRVTTDIPHHFRVGDVVYFYGVDGLYGVNGPTFTVQSVEPTSFVAAAPDGVTVSGTHVAGTGHVTPSLE